MWVVLHLQQAVEQTIITSTFDYFRNNQVQQTHLMAEGSVMLLVELLTQILHVA